MIGYVRNIFRIILYIIIKKLREVNNGNLKVK